MLFKLVVLLPSPENPGTLDLPSRDMKLSSRHQVFAVVSSKCSFDTALNRIVNQKITASPGA
jgi:hypothetical protein